METSPWPPGTDHRAEQGGRLGIGEAVDVEAVVVAGHQHVAARTPCRSARRRAGGNVRSIRCRHWSGRRRAAGLASSSFFFALGSGRSAALVGSKKPVGLPSARDQRQVARRLSGVLEAGLERHAGVGGERAQERAHPVDLGLLSGLHVARELEQHGVVGAAGLLHERVDHLQRAVVVRDHQGQEQPVEVGALQGREPGHVGGRGHAGHGALHVHPAMHRGIGHALAAFAQPVLHEGDLVGLRGVDPAGHRNQLGQVGAVFHHLGHLHGLVMVMDHVAHEGDVIDGVAGVGELDRLLRRQLRGLLPRRARLNDGNVLRGRGARGGQQQHDAGSDERARCATDAVMVHTGSPCGERGR